MNIKQSTSITFNTDESIKSTALSSPNELIMLMSSGTVIRYTIPEQNVENLFTIKSPFSHSDGGFDVDDQSTIYTLNSVIVVVNDFKRHGVVHYPDKYNSLRLWRGEYHVEITKFPIALFANDEGVPHLIYGNDWNHIQIMNLDTRQILTAAKSLIEEGAEEDHVAFYQKHEETNKLAWPRPYDYFYGRLEMSPNNKHFLSAGWAWGSSDSYTIYNVQDFIENPRISVRSIYSWEHDDRAVCWIDNQTIAVAVDPRVEDDETATKDSPHQLHFYRLMDSTVELDRKVDIHGVNLIHSEIYFNKELHVIVVVSDEIGVAVVSLDGVILLNEPEMKANYYNPKLNRFVHTENKTITIHELAS